MRKTLFIWIISVLCIYGREHLVKVEPYQRYMIKSAVAGRVILADFTKEGKKAADTLVVQIDDRLDRKDLDRTLSSIKLTEDILDITNRMLPGLKGTYEKKNSYYLRVLDMSTASKTQKDNAFSAMVSAKNQYLSTQEKVLNLKKQILDMRYKADSLRDLIAKKAVRLKDSYLYKLLVRKGDYAVPGMLLAIVDDLSRARLTLYLDSDEIKDIENKEIWINGKRSGYKFSSIWFETDEKHISFYKAEIITDPIYRFSSLVKVDIK